MSQLKVWQSLLRFCQALSSPLLSRKLRIRPHKEKVMPKVGGKHYAYTPKGMKAAKAAAKRTGKKIKKPKAKR